MVDSNVCAHEVSMAWAIAYWVEAGAWSDGAATRLLPCALKRSLWTPFKANWEAQAVSLWAASDYHRTARCTSQAAMNTAFRCIAALSHVSLLPGLEKVPISPSLVTLLHICGVIPTPQSPISPETPRERRCLHIERWYRRIELRVFRDVLRVSWCFTMF